ncbi:hypothetical protein Clacol_003321 [Clathrus columnatus]|uniref:Uncharacterized protein n=1 Tax=Clathrus columnatus TaxID=1419009 RepID=A0AAV5A8N3_9AGAM|nr:hypothetical protein Clacol_003321 [Clathrus columnatus]
MLDVIEKAKTSTLLAEKLRTLNSLTFAGGPLSERAIEWAVGMDIRIVVRLNRNCPPAPFRNPTDGKYHTKDLFEPVDDGYIFRGRRDDIMIMEDSSNCDAKYLEDKIAYVCHDIISAFVVVGQGRPTPALLVEPQEELNTLSTTIFHNTLVSRLGEVNSTSYPHEKITPERIIVLPKGSLPISSLKGTVMRSKAELKFKSLLDKVYTGDSVWNEVRKMYWFFQICLRGYKYEWE